MQDYSEYIKPHSLKAESLGRPVVMCPLLLYTDDTSGNRSKKWNKFDCWCMLLAGLPRKEKSKLHNIHMITCSNKVSVLDMAMPMVDELLKLESGVVLYDAMLQQEVVVLAPVLAVLSDNPRHSELLNHRGGRARKFCRMCMVGNLFHNYHYYHTCHIVYMHVLCMNFLAEVRPQIFVCNVAFSSHVPHNLNVFFIHVHVHVYRLTGRKHLGRYQ